MPANSKERILANAIAMFSEKGYTETSMRDIAAATDIKASSIYNHFKCKKDILEHIIGLYGSFSQNKVPFIDEEYVRTVEPEKVLHQLFFSFDPDNSMMYRQILKIFLQEQYRVDEIREFMKTQYLEGVYDYIKLVLDTMVRHRKLAPINTDLYAELLTAVNIKSTIAAGHYIDDPHAKDRDKWQESLDFVIDLILRDGGALRADSCTA